MSRRIVTTEREIVMRLKSVTIENFRAIRRLELLDLSRTIVIAGQNGSGKSCILDAIRLVKSVYGGYQANEYTMWFNEYNIPQNASPTEYLRLLRDKSKPMQIAMEFDLAPAERSYLNANADELAVQNAWRQVAPQQGRLTSGDSLATRERLHGASIGKRSAKDSAALRRALDAQVFTAGITLNPGQGFRISPSLVLEYLFSNFRPNDLGIIDFHGSNRFYARQALGNVDLNVQQQDQHFQNHALYNLQNKYQNFKSQLASQFVRSLLAQHAGIQPDSGASLTETLNELFATFFPGKTFLGAVPTQDGKLAFPVRTQDGKEHDIDDLSSGEKEVLYGYLRLRNATPQNSIVLIDEPELHLNPRLVRGLSNFYHQHLTVPLDCQLWLITHSDTLLRDSVGRPDFSVFYVRSAESLAISESQASPAGHVQAGILPLIEDLAGFKPQAKVVLLEGGGETKFDAAVIDELFPLFAKEVNLVSAGSKTRLRSLHVALEDVGALTDLGTQFYSIADRDSIGDSSITETARAFEWDVYHIENYLLSADHVFEAMRALRLAKSTMTRQQVQDLLLAAATRTIPSLVRHVLVQEANAALLKAIDLRPNRITASVADDIARVASGVPAKIDSAVASQLSAPRLTKQVSTLTTRFENDLTAGRWLKTFRGRDVLRQFVQLAKLRVDFEVFRFAIVAAMRHAQYQPTGMKSVLAKITAS
jgi:predicted ATPase